jgi:hypothetical protein
MKMGFIPERAGLGTSITHISQIGAFVEGDAQ